jgi:hypothetical protein
LRLGIEKSIREIAKKKKQIQKELKERKERLIKMASMTKEDFLREAGPHRKKTLDTIMD